MLIAVGHFRDLVAGNFRHGRYLARSREHHKSIGKPLAVLLKSWENFYTRRIYHRVQDCFNRPIGSAPSANFDMIERVSEDGSKSFSVLSKQHKLCTDISSTYESGKHFGGMTEHGAITRKCLNLGSYNYLGFADDWNGTCEKQVLSSLEDLPVSLSSSRSEAGTSKLHVELEEIVARFLNKEEAIVFNMGFNTNSTVIPALISGSRGQDLIISDELNHTSIVNGARASGASIRTFRHNDAEHLEEILKEAILMGRPRSRRPWNKILVIVEGVYSMEGEYCNLKAVSTICKKYKAYLYLDEAHSIGAMGNSGRGCCEYAGVDTADVDIMMGTFTKSFGGMGGYIAASKDVINHIKASCAGMLYHNSLSPVVCKQVITSFQIIMGEDGTGIGKQKLKDLRDNSNYFRMRLNDIGLQVLGNYDSPIMPVMLYNPTKIPAFSRECLKRGLAVVVVGFPAVPLLEARARFCISAGHKRDDLDYALNQIEEVAKIVKLRYGISQFG